MVLGRMAIDSSVKYTLVDKINATNMKIMIETILENKPKRKKIKKEDETLMKNIFGK